MALGARQARNELEQYEPGVQLRNDPAAGLNLNVADRAEAVQEAAAMYQPPPPNNRREDLLQQIEMAIQRQQQIFQEMLQLRN